MDIQNFVEEFKKTFVYDMLKDYVSDDKLFDHVVEGTKVIWMKEQTRQIWSMWQAAKEQTPGWISVQSKMPEQGQKILVFRPHAHEKPHQDPNYKICTYAGEGIFINSHFEHEITHWMPLTNPLEQKS